MTVLIARPFHLPDNKKANGIAVPFASQAINFLVRFLSQANSTVENIALISALSATIPAMLCEATIPCPHSTIRPSMHERQSQ